MTEPFPPGGTGTPVVSPFTRFANFPADSGLYRAENEKDACGLAVIAKIGRAHV